MLKKMFGEGKLLSVESKVGLTQLKPFRASLLSHVRRENHRFACYKKLIFQVWISPSNLRTTKAEFGEKKNIIETLSKQKHFGRKYYRNTLDANLNDKLAKNGEGVDFEESSGFEEDDKDTEV